MALIDRLNYLEPRPESTTLETLLQTIDGRAPTTRTVVRPPVVKIGDISTSDADGGK